MQQSKLQTAVSGVARAAVPLILSRSACPAAHDDALGQQQHGLMWAMYSLPVHPLGHLLMLQGSPCAREACEGLLSTVQVHRTVIAMGSFCVEGRARAGLTAHLLLPLQEPPATTATVGGCGVEGAHTSQTGSVSPLQSQDLMCTQQMCSAIAQASSYSYYPCEFLVLVQVPTTVMATVDSSVGGKTGVNHPLGKNMIGAFYQPRCVLIDTLTLDSLPDRELASGISEIVKYGLIRDADLFAWLEANMGKLLDRDAEVRRAAE